MIWIILAIVAAVVLWFVFTYNGFIRLKTRCEEAWADIDVQLKRRYDLIPNLVNTVQGYAAHERGVFERVTEARANALTAETKGDIRGVAAAENMLTGALKSLFAVAEAYPDLKANENFLQLQRELADTENKIQAARRFYNGNVRDLNIRVRSFPPNLVAQFFSFGVKEFFELEEGPVAAKEPVKVSF